MGSYKEPVPGWTDNFNGPTGILAGKLCCHRLLENIFY